MPLMSKQRIAGLSDLVEGEAVRVDVDGSPICVVRAGRCVYAIDDTCSHGQASLSEGEVDLDDLVVECPLHGSPFRLVDGVPIGLPATKPVATHTVTIEGDDVLIDRPA
jgi:3-phenylpropionate/trans-cinnamate dioxygenase ferredoxin subunit